MVKNEFKQGDKVYMAYDPTISAIVTDVCDEGKCDYYVREDGAKFTQGCYECELLDAKTAFLTRLQSLLREFDATIEVMPYYETSAAISLYMGGKTFINIQEVKYLTADNIMDFDKE